MDVLLKGISLCTFICVNVEAAAAAGGGLVAIARMLMQLTFGNDIS